MLEFKTSIDNRYIDQPIKSPCECKQPSPFKTESSIICKVCGIDLQSDYGIVYDTSPRRMFNNDEYTNRSTNHIVMDRYRPRTMYRDQNDYKKTRLDPKTIYIFNRIYREDSQFIMKYTDRIMIRVQMKLSLIINIFPIPSFVIEDIKHDMIKVMENNILRGRSIETFLWVLFYVHCRKHNIPRSYDEILSHSNIQKCLFFRAFQLLKKIGIIKTEKTSVSDMFQRYCSYITMACNKLAIEQKDINAIIIAFKPFYLKYRVKNSGKNPLGSIAGFIYYIGKQLKCSVTERSVGKACGISEVTIRTNLKMIKKFFY